MKSLKEEIATALIESVSISLESVAANSTALMELMKNAGSGALKGSDLAKRIDHTLLKAEATRIEIEKICQEALAHHFASVCVNSGRIADAVAFLGTHSDVLPIAVVGFPLGAMSTDAKAEETRDAVKKGAKEIDMVVAIGLLKDGNFEAVESDVRAVVAAAAPYPVKVILETCLLTDAEKVTACVIAKRAGARFVKTSTGFAKGGATVEDIRLMRKTVGAELGVKASGGIRTREDALKMIAAGATRVGASASVSICSDKVPEENTSNSQY